MRLMIRQDIIVRFQYEGYELSKSEKIISDNLSLFFRGITGVFSEEPYQKGDILYVDGSPYESPFYAVDCGKRLLYIENAESVTRCLQYDLVPQYYPKREIELRYRDTIPLCYKVQKVEECSWRNSGIRRLKANIRVKAG